MLTNAVKDLFKDDFEVKVWDEGVFNLNNSTLEDLLRAVDEFDFAIFIFAADDLIRAEQARIAKVRDNVVFELGLFMGHIGKERTFWMVPRGPTPPVLPTDLLGITHVGFEPPDVSAACEQLRAKMTEVGRRTDRAVFELEQPRILCVASPQFSTPEFEADHKTIVEMFPDAVIDWARHITANTLVKLLSQRKWDFIHLAAFVDPTSGDIILDGGTSPDRDRLGAKGFVRLIKMASARLVAIPTCDSLSLASQLWPVTSVIAGKRMISIRASQDWAVRFYGLMGQGQALSDAFAVTQAIADNGLVLIARQDLRVVNLARHSEI